MAVVSDNQMIKKFGPEVPWDTLGAKSVCILPLKGRQYHRQLKCQDSTSFCVSQSCVWYSHTAVTQQQVWATVLRLWQCSEYFQWISKEWPLLCLKMNTLGRYGNLQHWGGGGRRIRSSGSSLRYVVSWRSACAGWDSASKMQTNKQTEIPPKWKFCVFMCMHMSVCER